MIRMRFLYGTETASDRKGFSADLKAIASVSPAVIFKETCKVKNARCSEFATLLARKGASRLCDSMDMGTVCSYAGQDSSSRSISRIFATPSAHLHDDDPTPHQHDDIADRRRSDASSDGI